MRSLLLMVFAITACVHSDSKGDALTTNCPNLYGSFLVDDPDVIAPIRNPYNIQVHMETDLGNDVFTLYAHGVSYADAYAALLYTIKPGNPADPTDNCKPGGVGNQTCELSPVTAEGDGQISLTFQYASKTTKAADDYSLMTLDFNRWSLDPIKEPAVNGCNRGWRMKGLNGWVDYCYRCNRTSFRRKCTAPWFGTAAVKHTRPTNSKAPSVAAASGPSEDVPKSIVVSKTIN